MMDIHTNAGGGHGTVALCNLAGKAWATALYNAVAPLTPDADRGVKISTDFWFLKMGYKACIFEMLFHDCADEMAWYKQNYATLAQGLVEGAMDYFGISGEVGNVKGIILTFGDADWDAAKVAHNKTGFPITSEDAYRADPFNVGVRIHVGGPDLQNTPTDIYCAGMSRMDTLIDVLRELHII
jgi:hypothetical protein